MSGREDPLGVILSGAGALSRLELAELVELQRSPLPLASLCYVLGLADEETLARALARQLRIGAVVLDRSIISLGVLDGAAPELALEHRILPVAEDRNRLLVACERPSAVRDVLRELEFIKGKPVVACVALKVTLERTLRTSLRAHSRGDDYLIGALAAPAKPVGLQGAFVVPESSRVAIAAGSRDESASRSVGEAAMAAAAAAASAVRLEVTREVGPDETLGEETGGGEDTAIGSSPDDESDFGDAESSDPAVDGAVRNETEPNASPTGGAGAPTPILQDGDSGGKPLVSANTAVSQMARRGAGSVIELIDLDGREGVEYKPFRGPPTRVLVVDDDFASRQLLAKEVAALGSEVQSASHGGEALARIASHPPDVIVVDIMLPEIDGFHICRAVKESRKYGGIAVVLISAVINSGRVTDEVLRRYGADAYFEKPIHVDRLLARLQELLAARTTGQARGRHQSFERAMSLYRAGEVDAAVGELRRGIEEHPRSAKYHFVLANILHKKALIPEAIDEYEATLEIKPDYFPAMTRLAYLYYRQGYAARAIDTWRRSLPLCADPALRHNIELFMRKLIAELER